MIKRRKIIVSKDFNSLRLDQFLNAELPSVSRGYIQKIIKKGNILINDKPGKKGDILKKGDLVYIKELLESGKIMPVIDGCYPLSKTPEAFWYFEKVHPKGKVVITMQENQKTQ